MDTQMVDQEPQRSVQLIRRLDTRVPTPLLSAVIGTPPVSAASGLGRLATNMRGGPPLAPALVRPVAAAATSAPGAGRGWTAIVARAPGPAPAGSSPPAAVPAPLPIARLPSTAPVKASDIDTSADVAATPAEDVPDNWEDDV
jgi:transcriptional repressor NF-X1